jgi:hypothetical protein
VTVDDSEDYVPPEYRDGPAERVVPRVSAIATPAEVAHARAVMADVRAKLGPSFQRKLDEKMKRAEALEMLDMAIKIIRAIPLPFGGIVATFAEGIRDTIHRLMTE